MENDYTQTGAERSAEEVAWDQEFSAKSETNSGLGSTLGDLAKLTVQVPTAVVRMMGVMFPEDTRRHARAAARESFLTVRSLAGTIADGIEGLLADREGTTSRPTVSGPQGTWGTARATGTATATPATPTSSTARRISISDPGAEVEGPVEAPTWPVGDEDVPEDRGLRADIDY